MTAIGQNPHELTVRNRVPGSLEDVISGYDITKIEKLTVSGLIDARDYLLILFKMKALRYLDLSKASIAACKFENPYFRFSPPKYSKGKANTLTFGYRIVEALPAGAEESVPYQLEKIILPESLEMIADGVFDGDMDEYKRLKGEIKLPVKLRYIGLSVFSGSKISYALPFPESLEFLGSGRVSAYGELLLPRKLRYFNRVGFESPEVTSYALSEGKSAFRVIDGVLFTKDCKKLLAFPQGRAGSYKIPESVKEIAPGAFFNCQHLKEVVLNEDLEVISDSAFYLCESLEDIKMNKSLRMIGRAAFGICRKLKNIELPEGLQKIKDEAFMGCDNFSKLTIPASVEEENMGCMDFGGGIPITVEFRSEFPYKDGMRILGKASWNKNVKVKVPQNQKEAYLKMDRWNGFVIED